MLRRQKESERKRDEGYHSKQERQVQPEILHSRNLVRKTVQPKQRGGREGGRNGKESRREGGREGGREGPVVLRRWSLVMAVIMDPLGPHSRCGDKLREIRLKYTGRI